MRRSRDNEKTIEIKMKSISALDDEILNEIAEDNLQEEMEIATLFEIEIGKELDKFKDILSKYKDPKWYRKTIIIRIAWGNWCKITENIYQTIYRRSDKMETVREYFRRHHYEKWKY